MAPIARELSSLRGVLEPLQSASSVEGQVQELRAVLHENADLPVTLIGWSWGAWLGFILASRYPSLVGKLILIGSGPFEEAYAQRIMETRLSRLSEAERAEAFALMENLGNPEAGEQPAALAHFGALMSKADTYDPLPHQSEGLGVQGSVYRKVWREAAKLRSSGGLLSLGEKIQCPVVAIHGDYDPHPFEGVRDPLSRILRDFRFILLENCGHEPWFERAAKDRFYRTLKDELE
jgi:pimeloyl-ACP methyl ester carboxylesterase